MADVTLALSLLRDSLRFAQSKTRPYCDASLLSADLKAAIEALESSVLEPGEEPHVHDS